MCVVDVFLAIPGRPYPACKYIAEHCSARVIVVDGQKQLDKILSIRHGLPKLIAIVVYGGEVAADVNDGLGDGEAKVGHSNFKGLKQALCCEAPGFSA
jgi:hypothetical protein